MRGTRGDNARGVGPGGPAEDMRIACYILNAISIGCVVSCWFVMDTFVITECIGVVFMLVLVLVTLGTAVAMVHMVHMGRVAINSESGTQLSPGGRGRRGARPRRPRRRWWRPRCCCLVAEGP